LGCLLIPIPSCIGLSTFSLLLLLAVAAAACASITKLIARSGNDELRPVSAVPPPAAPHVLIFALDGVGYDQFNDAIRLGASPNVDAVLGKPEPENGFFEHGYSIPNAVSVLPSTTVDAWTATFTGTPPAFNGVTGNEWFERETSTFFAPAPVSLPKARGQTAEVYSDDLIGKRIQAPTLFEKVRGPSFVSLNGVYRGLASLPCRRLELRRAHHQLSRERNRRGHQARAEGLCQARPRFGASGNQVAGEDRGTRCAGGLFSGH
jgi:hypothetical protein